MRPTTIPDEEVYEGFRRVVVAGPNGDLTNSGESPDKAFAVEAMVGEIGNWPCFIEKWIPEPGDLEKLTNGGHLELRLYVKQLVVHSITVVEQA